MAAPRAAAPAALAATLPATCGWFGASAAAPIASASTTFIVACAGARGGGAAGAVATIHLARPLAGLGRARGVRGRRRRYEPWGNSAGGRGPARGCSGSSSHQTSAFGLEMRDADPIFSQRAATTIGMRQHAVKGLVSCAAKNRLDRLQDRGKGSGFFSARDRRRSVLRLAQSAPLEPQATRRRLI